MKRSLLTAGLAATLVVAACADGATSPSGGVYGVVKRGPTMPVCMAGESCTEPAAGVTLTFLSSGRAAGRVRTDKSGAYRIRLAPGTYAVRTSAKPFGAVPTPARVRVLARFTRVDFEIDTGIR